MSKDLFGGLKSPTAPAEIDLSGVDDVGPPEVAPAALKAAQADGEAKGFRSRRESAATLPALAKPSRSKAPTPAAPPAAGRVPVRQLRASQADVGRGMTRASFTALMPIDLMERFMALEEATGAKRWHLLILALEALEEEHDAGTLRERVRASVQAWSETVEAHGARSVAP